MTVFCSPCGKLVDTEEVDGEWRYPEHTHLDGSRCGRSGEVFVPPWARSG